MAAEQISAQILSMVQTISSELGAIRLEIREVKAVLSQIEKTQKVQPAQMDHILESL